MADCVMGVQDHKSHDACLPGRVGRVGVNAVSLFKYHLCHTAKTGGVKADDGHHLEHFACVF